MIKFLKKTCKADIKWPYTPRKSDVEQKTKRADVQGGPRQRSFLIVEISLKEEKAMKERMTWILWAVVFAGCFFFSEKGQTAQTPTNRVSIAVSGEPTTLDQSLVSVNADSIVLENWGEYLVAQATNGEMDPGLASWKISPDGKVIEFELRKGVKFHSGDPFTTKDVLFSFERTKEKNPGSRTRLRSVDKLEIIDDYRLKIHFKAPDVTFMPNRGGSLMIVSKTYYDRVGEDVFTRQPSGTGPYKVVRYVPGEYIDIERFEGYWGPKPPIKEARFYIVPEDTTRVAKLKAGEVDFIQSVPLPSVKDLESGPNFKLVKLATGHPNKAVVFHNRNPKVPWYDRKVRLAMAYAIDWKTIINGLMLGIPNHWPWLGQLSYRVPDCSKH